MEAASVGAGAGEVILYTMDIVDHFDIERRSTRLA
jgi:hypothetical protein